MDLNMIKSKLGSLQSKLLVNQKEKRLTTQHFIGNLSKKVSINLELFPQNLIVNGHLKKYHFIMGLINLLSIP